VGKIHDFLENPYNRERIKRILASIVLISMLVGIILSIVGAATGNQIK